MEFGVLTECFSDYPWKDFLRTASGMGVEAIELDSRSDAHCGTWSPDVDPESVSAELKGYALRVGAVTAYSDLVQQDEGALEREVEAARSVLDLAFRYRTEVVRIAPQRPKPGMSREEMITSIQRGCKRILEHAEDNALLVCLHPDREVLRDVETLRGLIEASESYNLRAVLDVVALLHSSHDVEAVRQAVEELVPYVSHVCLRDAKLNPSTGAVTEVPVGQGDCPVEMVVSEMMVNSYFRPFYVAYYGENDAAEAVKQGVDYFRELPERLLSEVGIS